MVFEEAIKCKADNDKAALAAAAASGKLVDSPLVKAVSDNIELENSPLYSKVLPDGRIACKAPDCTKMVSAQNIARYVPFSYYQTGMIFEVWNVTFTPT